MSRSCRVDRGEGGGGGLGLWPRIYQRSQVLTHTTEPWAVPQCTFPPGPPRVSLGGKHAFQVFFFCCFWWSQY